jgi:hypothetical protein
MGNKILSPKNKLLLRYIYLGTFLMFIITLFFGAIDLGGKTGLLSVNNKFAPVYNDGSEFDPELAHLDDMNKLQAYCDSIYNADFKDAVNDPSIYPSVVGNIVRKRFFHGYSYYSLTNNYVARIVSKLSNEGFGAIVVPDDILKFPYGACSQQSIVLMELVKNKGYKTRKVGFWNDKIGGHFCCEIFYNDQWHFFDPDLEPNQKLLASHNIPGIQLLSNNKQLLDAAYKHINPVTVNGLFPNYKIGNENEFPAPRAIIFQHLTKFLSYTLWIFFGLALLWMRRKYNLR